jgi:hypothetical protein
MVLGKSRGQVVGLGTLRYIEGNSVVSEARFAEGASAWSDGAELGSELQDGVRLSSATNV